MLCLEDAPPGMRERIENIAVSARLLKARIDIVYLAIVPAPKPAGGSV